MIDSDENVSKKYFDEKINKLMEKMDWIIGKYRDHDQEHILLNNKVSEHSDNLELINAKVGIQI